MSRWRFVLPWRGTDPWTGGPMAYAAGQVVEFGEDRAAWYMRDRPGCLERIPEMAPISEDEEPSLGPPIDRMVRQAPKATVPRRNRRRRK